MIATLGKLAAPLALFLWLELRGRPTKKAVVGVSLQVEGNDEQLCAYSGVGETTALSIECEDFWDISWEE